jgi:hypothetical protein
MRLNELVQLSLQSAKPRKPPAAMIASCAFAGGAMAPRSSAGKFSEAAIV